MNHVQCLEFLRKHKGSMAKRLGWRDEMYIYYVNPTIIETIEQCTQFQLKKVMKKNKSPIKIDGRFDLIDCKNDLVRLNRTYYFSNDTYSEDWVVMFVDGSIYPKVEVEDEF